MEFLVGWQPPTPTPISTALHAEDAHLTSAEFPTWATPGPPAERAHHLVGMDCRMAVMDGFMNKPKNRDQ